MTHPASNAAGQVAQAPAMCPSHLVIVPCGRCPEDRKPQVRSTAAVQDAARFADGDLPRCISKGCDSVPAVVSGMFDPSAINGKPPSPASYCIRCGILLNSWGPFEPTEVLRHVPADVVLVMFYPEAHDLVKETLTFQLITAT